MKNKTLIISLNKILKDIEKLKKDIITEYSTNENFLFEDKEILKNINEPEYVKQIIDYISKKSFDFGLIKYPMKHNQLRIKKIIQIMKAEKVSLNLVFQMIDSRFILWGMDTKMQRFLTVETLFRPVHFLVYIEQSANIIANSKKNNSSKSWTDK